MIDKTLIAVPNGSKQIHLIKQNEEVLAASAQIIKGKLELAWDAIKVSYSADSGSSSRSTLFYLDLATESQRLVCTMDQPFLLANGKYTIATKLVPGQHFLVDKEGNKVRINGITVRQYHGSDHAIATMEARENSPDGHLLLAEGVVVGDFWLQVNFSQLPESMKQAD